MNKYYPTKELVAGLLTEINSSITLKGIKNVIGIVVKNNEEELFYSILDDCFFRILPTENEIINNKEYQQNRLFVEPYDQDITHIQSIGKEMIKKTNITFISKSEIIKFSPYLGCYISDFDYKDNIETNTKVDYEKPLEYDSYIIDSIQEYEDKLGKNIDKPIEKKKQLI